MTKPVFAVDVGGVLFNQQHDGEPMRGCREGLLQLTAHFDLKVVSMCGRNTALKTRERLEHHGLSLFFSEQVYLPFGCKNKNEHLKKIGASFFVDDRIKHVRPALVVSGMRHVFHMSFFEERLHTADPRYHWVLDWQDLIERSRGLR